MDRRLRYRQPLDVVLMCRIPATPYKVRLIDASRGGCRLSFRRITLEKGQSVVLELGDGARIQGTVIWRTALEAGLQFDKPLRSEIALFLGLEDDARRGSTALAAQAGAEQPARDAA